MNNDTTRTYVDDDEISTILRHFRPKPGFISTASASKGHEWMKSGSSRGGKNQQKYNRGYTSVQYIAPESNDSDRGKIRLSYLHTHHIMQNNNQSSIPIFLTFEISVNTRLIACSDCNAPTTAMSESIQSQLNKLCNELSTTKDTATTAANTSTLITNKSSPSLFLIASQLLQLLNNNFPTISQLDDDTSKRGESFDKLVSRVANNNTTTTNKEASMHSMIDIQTLLMRCAASGRNRNKVCTPVPVEFNTFSGNDDALSHRIFGASNQLYIHGFRGQQQQMIQQQNDKSEEAKTLLTFLLSLPWTGGSRLVNSSISSSSTSSSTTSSKSKVAKLTININTALGSPSPSFTAHANKYGTITAYHGTKIESTWSIINHGLINLSYHGSLSANGAMLGEGVYLSSSKQVAEYFAQSAAQSPVPALASSFQHECILHLLCLGNVDISDLEPLNSYDITCLPVFEATIIKPSSSTSGEDGLSSTTTTSNKSTSNANPTIQDGKYYVCKDSEYIRLTNLHLTIELRKKTSIWSWITPSSTSLPLIVIVIALLWIMMTR